MNDYDYTQPLQAATEQEATGQPDPETGWTTDWPADSDEIATGGWHPVNVLHLIFGLLFAGVAVIWVWLLSADPEPRQLAYLVPGLLTAAGVAGLLALVLSARRR